MTRHLLNKFLLWAFALFTLPAAGQTVWDGTADTEWYTNGPDTDGAYHISTAAELAGLAKLVNNRIEYFSGKIIYLDKDIQLNDTENWESWDASTSGLKSWTPIGGDLTEAMDRIYFSGTFDGQGHTISGIYIAFMGDAVESYNYQGLFGYIDGVVRNLNVTESYIYFELFSYIGGIAGYSIGTVENCTNSGTVKGNGADRVGGIGGDASEIKNCSNSGAVTGDGYVGGIAGMAVNSTHSDGFLENCFNAGTVTGTSKVGGIAGDVFSTTQTITRCYYLDTSCAKGLGGDKSSATIVTESKDKEEFAGGEVTRLLQGERTERIWGQKLDGSEDSLPVLLSFLSEEERAGYIVYTVTFTYEETPDATEKATEVQYGNSGAAITAPTVSEAKGYLFVWDKEIPRAIDTENVEINGEFKKLFTLTIYQPDDDGHGSFIATAGGEEIKSGSDVAEGTEVTLVPTPDEGYGVDKWLVKDSEDKEIEVLDENTFVMPSDNVTVTVVFAKVWTNFPTLLVMSSQAGLSSNGLFVTST